MCKRTKVSAYMLADANEVWRETAFRTLEVSE